MLLIYQLLQDKLSIQTGGVLASGAALQVTEVDTEIASDGDTENSCVPTENSTDPTKNEPIAVEDLQSYAADDVAEPEGPQG